MLSCWKTKPLPIRYFSDGIARWSKAQTWQSWLYQPIGFHKIPKSACHVLCPWHRKKIQIYFKWNSTKNIHAHKPHFSLKIQTLQEKKTPTVSLHYSAMSQLYAATSILKDKYPLRLIRLTISVHKGRWRGNGCSTHAWNRDKNRSNNQASGFYFLFYFQNNLSVQFMIRKQRQVISGRGTNHLGCQLIWNHETLNVQTMWIWIRSQIIWLANQSQNIIRCFKYSLLFLLSFSYSSSSSESSSAAGKREKPLGAPLSCLSFLFLQTQRPHSGFSCLLHSVHF